MSDHPSNPTLVVGLGPFGRRVVDELEADHADEPALVANGYSLNGAGAQGAGRAAGPGPIRNLELIRVAIAEDEDAPFDALHAGEEPDAAIPLVYAEASTRCRWLLDLSHFLETTGPSDTRGPRLDIFVIADISEPGVAELVAPLVERLAQGLRETFRPILRGGEGALAVCPMLATPRDTDPASVASVVEHLTALAEKSESALRPQARMYLVEDQSGKYVVSRGELVRSFAAFIHLLLFSQLRDQGSIRSLVERADQDPTGPFASFVCATLEVDMDALHRLCALRLAREVLDQFRSGEDPVLTEIAGEAHPLVPDPVTLAEELWKEKNVGTLEDHLQPPALSVPEIVVSDEPEDIVETKLGALWEARTWRTIEQYRDEVERFNMDHLSEEIEQNGAALIDRLTDETMRRVTEQVSQAPRGHARALEFVRYAATHADGRAETAASQISAPDLPQFPPPPIPRHLAAVREAAFARPRRRPFRMRMFGILLWVIGTVMWAGLVAAGFRLLGWNDALGWPPFAVGAVLAGSSLYYMLWAHRKRHHNWVVECRNSLDQALKRYMRNDVVAYFRRRLHYTRLLWVYRVYRRIADQLNELVEQLEGTRAACAEADHILAAREREVLEDLGASARTGILFRGLLVPETVDVCYRAVRPPEIGALADELLRRALADPDTDTLEAPFADPDRLLELCLETLRPMTSASPFRPGAENPLAPAVSAGVTSFLRQLAVKLSLPLELVESVAMDAPPTAHIAVVPSQAQSTVEETLREQNLGGDWNVLALSEDPHRVHLILERGGLSHEAIARARKPSEVARR